MLRSEAAGAIFVRCVLKVELHWTIAVHSENRKEREREVDSETRTALCQSLEEIQVGYIKHTWTRAQCRRRRLGH